MAYLTLSGAPVERLTCEALSDGKQIHQKPVRTCPYAIDNDSRRSHDRRLSLKLERKINQLKIRHARILRKDWMRGVVEKLILHEAYARRIVN